ncbi:MAG TPA: hypothetical protein VMG98_16685 [Verrucomicrobiae bacterium]|nr:hypothetical protein [Verrucomicrobiae bacterium]
MKRRYGWLPVLAAPITVVGHIVSEAIASGKDVLAVAWEPAHLVLLLLAVAAIPLWLRAANRRRLGSTIAVAIALSLLVEGNGLSAIALAVAVVISALFGFFGGWVIESARFGVPDIGFKPALPPALVFSAGVPSTGPYFAFVATRGNRPPPTALGRL